MGRILFIFLLLLVSCTPIVSKDITTITEYHIKRSVIIDNKFSSSDKIAIKNAIDDWNLMLNGQLNYSIVEPSRNMNSEKMKELVERGDIFIIKIDGKNPMIRKGDNFTIGFTDKKPGNFLFLVRERIKDEDLSAVVKHEFSHTLGSSHLAGTTMNSFYVKRLYNCIDFETVKQVAEVQHLDLDNLNYCIRPKL